MTAAEASGAPASEAGPARPAGGLRALEKSFILVDRAVGRWAGAAWNPLLHTGAIAVSSLLVATVTGIALLVWYKPSVHLAFDSVEAMSAAPFGAGFLRSLHRYSSDAAMFFAVIHALRIFFERRFDGPRWLAWVTGAMMLGIVWFIGWTGYWLVWDLRGQSVAVASAKLLDVVPIFADPLSRSFVTDEGVHSLLFFVVFFIHMLVPLALGVVAWLHITRLARPRFLTSRLMSVWLGALLVLLCVAYPAESEAPAAMLALPQPITMDWWYLYPLPLIDRMGGAAFWALSLAGTAAVLTLPWWLAGRREAPASVVVSRCNACEKCYADCPYDAIQMVPRTDERSRYPVQASVIESKCVSCGICAGSCDTMGVGVDWMSTIDARRRIGAWLKQAETDGEAVHLAIACAECAGAALEVDAATGRCAELPGYRVLRVPCAGWVHPQMVERALRQGARGVLLATCPSGQCLYREGEEWTRQRLEGSREPALRADKVGPSQLELLALDRTRGAELRRQATSFREGGMAGAAAGRTQLSAAITSGVLLVLLALATGLVSDLGYAAPRPPGSEFVVSLKHPGAESDHCRTLSEEELARLPAHMRRPEVCERSRAPVRLRVFVDGAVTLDSRIDPSGLWSDGNSVAIEKIRLETGDHRVRVEIGETRDPDEWTFTDERTLSFDTEARHVVVFDRVAGFQWH